MEAQEAFDKLLAKGKDPFTAQSIVQDIFDPWFQKEKPEVGQTVYVHSMYDSHPCTVLAVLGDGSIRINEPGHPNPMERIRIETYWSKQPRSY